jgi:hypothetical protein
MLDCTSPSREHPTNPDALQDAWNVLIGDPQRIDSIAYRYWPWGNL